jgi:hypothetical protein
VTDAGSSALVGHTGFVGGNLLHQADFDALYNSRNIDEIDGKVHSHIVVSAAQAKKWWANQNPQEDWSGIERLLGSLARCKARRVTLISTIDVLGSAAGLTERDSPASEEMTAYGLHRLKLEQAVRSQFEQVLVVRLPGLFGLGLKKNVIFDLLQHNALENINPRSSYQYYDLSNLWRHIQIAWAQRLELVHLFPAPITTSELIDTFFPGTAVGATAAPEAHYDHRTIHGALFGGDDKYVSDKATVMRQLEHFVESQRSHTP